ncbi:hypothetical protein [Nitrosomonas sp. Nm33]|uniref:hypothetical protein n=1 Tax=Nitrosomonas sp. Nm33 TaxID=133724 RepID=UPI00089AEE8E|nr:hypothetical protein [Nitrosomonas sp. Nm33]SDZ17767.1 hypothetical protein SAMN05421755_11551 [Nitrosomonas sp. Nm33]
MRIGISGEVRDRYLDSVVPTLCKYDIYRRLRDVTDIQRWHNYDHAGDAWSLTVALPALVVSGHIERAINLLWKLTNYLETGWTNTECIHFAVRELDRRCRVGLIDFQLAQRFRYAVIGVLDAFRGEWFSRLRDLELVQAVVVLLSPWPSYTDYFRRDLVKSLVRNYGLSPEFWYLLHEQHPQLNDNELMRAGKYWDGLKQTFDSSRPVIQNLESLVEPIRYFRQMGNPEATIFLREVVVNALFILNDKLTSAGRMLISMLLEDPAEGVRLATFPLAKENQLQHEFPEMKERLIQTLRELSPRPGSMFYEAQRTAARLARTVTDALDQDDDSSLQRALDALQNHALNLNDWQNGFLGADLLGYCCECRLGKDMQVENLLLFLEKIINKAIEETKVDYFLPPPVQSALMRLVRWPEEKPLLRLFLANIKATVSAKFGNKHDDIFNTPTKLESSMPATGYPSDTLVVIYSCRKYLDTRIEAIRATWVQDLKARSIPYLIL